MPRQPGVVRSVMPFCYNDPGPVKAELDRRLGAHRYTLKPHLGQFVVDATRKLSKDEISDIYEKVKVHYHPAQ
ncbi:hypothetical protein LZ31DRAFT_560504 [Colletotrichum somersetense]|nr:hypothetical protein LZ31DRAFT_560504 [Colletotrichum somersetense]